MGEKQESKVCFDKIEPKHIEGLNDSKEFQAVAEDFKNAINLTKNQIVAFWSIVAGFMRQAGYQLLGPSLGEIDAIKEISCGNYQSLTSDLLEQLSKAARDLIKIVQPSKSHSH